MFTGIVQDVGQIVTLERRGGDVRLSIATGKLDLGDVKLGDSIATNGVCLTAVVLPGDGFVADVSTETLTRSTLKTLKVGDRVNLEKALTPQSRLGGHIVSGHVDGIGEVVGRDVSARAVLFRIKAPDELAKYIAEKGSITTDGISLTVGEVRASEFCVNLIPETLARTNLGWVKAGWQTNIEIDPQTQAIVDTVERVLAARQ